MKMKNQKQVLQPRILTLITLALLFLPGFSRTIHAEQPKPNLLQYPKYELTDLGTLGGPHSRAFGISSGRRTPQIVGDSWYTSNYPLHAFLSESGKMIDLGTLGGDQSTAYGVDNNRHVVGTSRLATWNWHAFVWEKGTITDLGTLGGDQSSAQAINNRGQIVGSSLTIPGSPYHHRAFLWQNGTMYNLGSLLGSDESHAYAINNKGQVAGYARRADLNYHAFLWENGEMKDLGTLPFPYVYSFANGINDSGQVVGYAQHWSTGTVISHAVLWKKDQTAIDLGTLGGNTSYAYGVNNSDQVVGTSSFEDPTKRWHAFLYRNGKMMDLNDSDISDASEKGFELQYATAIDSLGRIVGFGVTNNHVHAFLLTPATPWIRVAPDHRISIPYYRSVPSYRLRQ